MYISSSFMYNFSDSRVNGLGLTSVQADNAGSIGPLSGAGLEGAVE